MTTAHVTWGKEALTIEPSGFRWQRANGQVLEGPWSRVVSVMTFRASSSVNGVHVGSWQHFGMTFDSGEGFQFHSRAPQAFEAAPLAVRNAAPHIVPRVAAQLQAGQTVQFGPLSLSKSSVSFKSKTWPLAQVAGHRTDQGHWMMDVGPKDAPRLVVQVMLNQVPNFFAFQALLEQLAPGTDYGEQPPDLGTMFRPSASSHDPRYPAGRTRLMILGGLAGVGALIGLGFLGHMSWQSRQWEQARRAGEARLAGFAKVAGETQVPAGQVFSCDRSVTSPYEVVFATRGPKGVDRPGLVDRDMPFSLGSSGASVVGSFDSSPYFVLGEVRGVTGPAKGDRVVTMAMTVVDTASSKVVCTGELMGQFRDDSNYAASFAMSDLLLQSMCKGTHSTCQSALRTRLVSAAVAEEPPVGKNVAVAPVKAKAPVKKIRKR